MTMTSKELIRLLKRNGWYKVKQEGSHLRLRKEVFFMSKLFLTYPAIFTFEDNQYWVEFIDLKGCFSNGNTLPEAMEKSKEAMGLFLEDLKEFPNCTTDIKNIELNDNQIISFVSIDLEEHRRKYTNKSIKKTLSIPAWLNTLAEKENINFSQILQNALKDYLKIDDKKNIHDINI